MHLGKRLKSKKSMSAFSNYSEIETYKTVLKPSQNKVSDMDKAYTSSRILNSREKVDATLKRLQISQVMSLRYDSRKKSIEPH